MLKKAFLYRVALHELKQFSVSVNQKVVFCRILFNRTWKSPAFSNQKLFFCTNLSLLPSKAILFHPPLPIATSLNLLFAKNAAVLLLFALNPYAVKPEPRTDSNHCRRYPENAVFSIAGYLMNAGHFRKNQVSTGDLNRGSQGFAPRAFWLLFVRCKK